MRQQQHTRHADTQGRLNALHQNQQLLWDRVTAMAEQSAALDLQELYQSNGVTHQVVLDLFDREVLIERLVRDENAGTQTNALQGAFLTNTFAVCHGNTFWIAAALKRFSTRYVPRFKPITVSGLNLDLTPFCYTKMAASRQNRATTSLLAGDMCCVLLGNPHRTVPSDVARRRYEEVRISHALLHFFILSVTLEVQTFNPLNHRSW
ncbi:hypothetical protein DFJ77DRAFT_187875 [Powellomyces hirtus]|nr:hypothetical protein DFJ77DRAFT_187875 [Powellomyces hirtus]